MSACDAVDGALPGDRPTLRSVGADQAAKGADHGRDCDPRVGYREVCVSGHGVDAAGQVVVRRRMRRSHVLRFFAGLAPCIVGIEACATSHHWSRQLQVLRHSVKLMPPSYVRPYLKLQKNDMADAEAICEAVMRPTMRLVETKTPEQQGVLMLPRPV